MGETVVAARGPVARRLNVDLTGDPEGLPVVFAHGFGCDRSMWRFVAPAFEADFRVVVFDHVGSGGSDLSAYDPARHASLEGYAADVVELLDELALGPVAFVGHSASAMIGVLAEVRRPDLFSALVLVGGSPRYLDAPGYVGGFTRPQIDELLEAMESNFVGWSQGLAPVAMGNADRPELAEELAGSFARSERRILVEFARAIFLSDHRAALPRVTVPTLVLQTATDPMVPDSVAEHLHAQLPASTLVHLGAEGHFPHLSRPDETADVIRRYLDGLR